MNKAVVLAANLIAGNLILWFFEVSVRNQDHLDLRWTVGFSMAAIFALILAFRFINRDQTWLRSLVLAFMVSFFVPFLGLTFSFFNPNSLNASIVGALVGLVVTPLLWKWALPMFLLNLFLFHRLSKVVQ